MSDKKNEASKQYANMGSAFIRQTKESAFIAGWTQCEACLMPQIEIAATKSRENILNMLELIDRNAKLVAEVRDLRTQIGDPIPIEVINHQLKH